MHWLGENMEKFALELPEKFKAVWNQQPNFDPQVLALNQRAASSEIYSASYKNLQEPAGNDN
jgi:hypothetical protein